MMNSKNNNTKTKSTKKKKKITKVGNVVYSNRSVGFSITIPDNWLEIKRTSYEELGISDNTLFIFTTDKFSSLSAIFSGFTDKRKFNKMFDKYDFEDFKVILKKEEEINDLSVKRIVIQDGNKKILNNFVLINGMIVNFTINIDIRNRIIDGKGITTDKNYKLMTDVLKTLSVYEPINPPKYVNRDILEEEVEVEEVKVKKKEKTTAQIEIETDCKYKGIVLPEFYFKYRYQVDNDVVLLTVINDEVYFTGLNDEFIFIKDNRVLSRKIYRILSLFWDDLSIFDIGTNRPTENSNWVLKNKDSYLFIEMNEESTDTLSLIFNYIVNVLNNSCEEYNFFDYEMFPNFKEYLETLSEITDKYKIDLDGLSIKIKDKKQEEKKKSKKEKDNKYKMDINHLFDKNDLKLKEDDKIEKVTFDDENINNEYFIDFEEIFNEPIVLKEKDKKKKKKEELKQEEKKETPKENKYAIDIKNLFKDVDLKIKNKQVEKVEKIEEDNKYKVEIPEVITIVDKKEEPKVDKDFSVEIPAVAPVEKPHGTEEIISEHTVVENAENKYAIDINADVPERKEIKKYREYEELTYNKDDYQYYYHNISGHGLFKFLFPKTAGIKVIKDFNVFDLQNYGILSYRVFLFRCEDEEAYESKLEDWMKKNFTSNNYFLQDKYENDENGINIRTYLLNNNKFYKVAYISNYLVAISAITNDEHLMNANIALQTLEVTASDNKFIESYDRKMNSIYLLQQQEIPYTMELPEIKSSYEVLGKSLEEVTRRAIVLCIVCNFASDVINSKKKKYIKDSKKFFTKLLEQFNVKNDLTREERELFDKMDKNLAIQISWQFEGYYILLWALGLVDEIPFPDVLVDPDEITPIVSNCSSYKDFASKCLYRDVNDILDLADLVYRYDWYCVEEESKGLEPIINPEVVIERHRAVNWLISEENWDNVDIST